MIYFLSDIHLGAKYIVDPKKHEETIVRMLSKFGQDASHIFLLGDVLDYWFEYKTVVPRGYIRFFGALARLADSGVKITWLTGNHDIWLFDYLRNEIGIDIIDGPSIQNFNGKKFYLAHGDALGKLNKRSFRFIQALFRNKFCQKMYSAIHPRWTIPFAHRWSAGSRKSNSDYNSWRGKNIEPAAIFAENYLQKVDNSINFFIMGHRHLDVDEKLSQNCRFIILGDCFKSFSYAKFNGENLIIEHFDAENS